MIFMLVYLFVSRNYNKSNEQPWPQHLLKKQLKRGEDCSLGAGVGRMLLPFVILCVLVRIVTIIAFIILGSRNKEKQHPHTHMYPKNMFNFQMLASKITRIFHSLPPKQQQQQKKSQGRSQILVISVSRTIFE